MKGISKMNKALIAMSGGVDSSAAAYLTKEQGYSCIDIIVPQFTIKTMPVIDKL